MPKICTSQASPGVKGDGRLRKGYKFLKGGLVVKAKSKSTGTKKAKTRKKTNAKKPKPKRKVKRVASRSAALKPISNLVVGKKYKILTGFSKKTPIWITVKDLNTGIKGESVRIEGYGNLDSFNEQILIKRINAARKKTL